MGGQAEQKANRPTDARTAIESGAKKDPQTARAFVNQRIQFYRSQMMRSETKTEHEPIDYISPKFAAQEVQRATNALDQGNIGIGKYILNEAVNELRTAAHSTIDFPDDLTTMTNIAINFAETARACFDAENKSTESGKV